MHINLWNSLGDSKMNQQLKGLYFSLATMCLWGINMVIARYTVANLHMNSYLLSTIMLFVASSVLLLVAGKGAKVSESLKNPFTWIYSVLHIMLNTANYTALIYVTSTHSMLLQVINIILGFGIGSIFLGKKLSKNDILGSVTIFSGIVLLLSTLEFKQAVSGMSAVLLAATCHVLRTVIAEKHPIAREAKSFSDYCRVLAYILLTTSASCVFFALIVGVINQVDPTLELFSFLPSLNNMITKEQLLFTTGMGVFLMPLAMYCFFYGAQKAGTNNFLIYTAYMPVVTFTLEYFADVLGIMQAPPVTYKEILSALFIMGGSLYIGYSRNKAIKKSTKLAPKAKKELYVLRDTIKTALICFDDNYDEVAKVLGVGKRTLINIMTKNQAVSENIKNKIIYNHASKVASLDHLTGALNKSSCDLKLKDLVNVDKALVVFIDLDKFKPINDTYGHDAGDAILKGIADRLMEEFKTPNIVARLGGDEYCLIIYGLDQRQENKYVNKIKKLITEPFIIEGLDNEIQVDCSVGAAHYPSEGDCGLELKKVADERMYEEKANKKRTR